MDGPSDVSMHKTPVSTTNHIANSWKQAENDEKLYVSQSIITWTSSLIGRQA